MILDDGHVRSIPTELRTWHGCTNPTDGEMVAGGTLRSNVRVEIRIMGSSLWVAEAFTLIDGQEEKVQSYRLTRP